MIAKFIRKLTTQAAKPQCTKDELLSACLYHSIADGFTISAIQKAKKEFAQLADHINVNEFDVLNHCRQLCIANIKQSQTKTTSHPHAKIENGLNSLLDTIYTYKAHWVQAYKMSFSSQDRVLEAAEHFNKCINELMADKAMISIEYPVVKSCIGTFIIGLELAMIHGENKESLAKYITQYCNLYNAMDKYGSRYLNLCAFFTEGLLSAFHYSLCSVGSNHICKGALDKLIGSINGPNSSH